MRHAFRAARRSGVPAILAVLGAWLCLAAPAGAFVFQTPAAGALQTNGQVLSLLRSSTTGSVYLGGAFSRVGFTTEPGLATLNTSTGQANAAFPKTNGGVSAVVADGSGGYYVGGDFTRIGDVLRSHLAHVTSTGAVDGFDPSPNGTVNALALSGTTLYAGGYFTGVNTTSTFKARSNLAAFDTTTATNNATPFDPSANNAVYALAVSGTTLYAGGFFTTVNATSTSKTRNDLAAFDTTLATNNVTSFDPSAGGIVFTLALSGTTLYAGGSFTTVNTTSTSKTRNRLAAFDTTLATNNVTSFDPSLDNTVYALALSGTTLYAGGSFTTVNATFTNKTRNRLAAFDTTTATNNATSFDPSLDNTVYALALSGTTLYAGGSFTTVNATFTNKTRNRLAAFDTTTATNNATSFDPDADNKVNALALSGGALVAGGSFLFAGSPDDAPRNNLAAITSAGSLASFDPSPNGNVLALASSGTTLYASGSFNQVNTNAASKGRAYLAAFDTTTATNNATTFDPSPSNIVDALALSGTTLYAGGIFTSVNTNGASKARTFLAAFDTTTATNNVTTFDPSPSSGVSALALSGTTLYASGSFNSVNTNGASKARTYLAAFDTTTATNNATTFDPSPNDVPAALALSGTTLYAGGGFTSVNTNGASKARAYLAAFDTTTAANNATGFDPSLNGVVNALALSGTTLYVGGNFNSVNTTSTPKTRNNLAAFDTTVTTNNATAFDPGLNSSVSALAVSPTALYVGGAFNATRTSTGPANFALFNGDTATAVGWAGVRARRHGRRTVISWRTGAQADVLGYTVVRARRGHRTRVTRKLIAGGALRPRTRYRVVDRHARRGDRYFVVEHHLSGRTVTHGPIVARR